MKKGDPAVVRKYIGVFGRPWWMNGDGEWNYSFLFYKSSLYKCWQHTSHDNTVSMAGFFPIIMLQKFYP